MKIQILVAAMNQVDHALLKKMNIMTDVIVGNQCDHNSVEQFEYQGFHAVYLNCDERGVGLNRNNTLMRATGDICLFADDDMIYHDESIKIITDAFTKYSDADVIIFNIVGRDTDGYRIRKAHKVHYFNYLKYGTARIAFKLNSIRTNTIFFNQCFGGGTEHCHGEDNLFLTDCLKKKLKIYAVPDFIATLTEERSSTWNIGYDEKYLRDQGDLYRAISRRWWKLLCFQDAVRKHKEYNRGMLEAYHLMKKKQLK